MSTPFTELVSAIAPSGRVRLAMLSVIHSTGDVLATFECPETGNKYTATVPGNNPELAPALWMAAREANEVAKKDGVC